MERSGSRSVQIMTDPNPGGPKPLYKIAGNSSIPKTIVGLVPVVTLWAFSSGSAPLMRIPLVAPTPVPTMTAVGVARPSEQGHAAAGSPIHTFSFKAVFRIHDILVWIRIRGFMPLTNESRCGCGSGCGSFYFHLWPSRRQQKTNLKKKFSCILCIYHKPVEIKVFLIIFGSGSIPLTNGSGSGRLKTRGSGGFGFGSGTLLQTKNTWRENCSILLRFLR